VSHAAAAALAAAAVAAAACCDVMHSLCAPRACSSLFN